MAKQKPDWADWDAFVEQHPVDLDFNVQVRMSVGLQVLTATGGDSVSVHDNTLWAGGSSPEKLDRFAATQLATCGWRWNDQYDCWTFNT